MDDTILLSLEVVISKEDPSQCLTGFSITSVSVQTVAQLWSFVEAFAGKIVIFVKPINAVVSKAF